MARIRTIKPQFFSSHDVAKLSFRERITWIGLWTHVDDEGRCQDDGRIIKGAIFPLEDTVTWQDVDSDISQLADVGLITRYEVSGSKYLLITNWKKHQKINRPTKSFIPAPSETLTEDSLRTHGVITEDSRWEKEKEKEKEGETPTRIPESFLLTPELREWASKNTPGMDLETKHKKFVSHYQSATGDSAIKLDWNRAWQTWMLGDFDKQQASKPQPIPFRTPADTRMEDLFCKDHTGWPQGACERCEEEQAVSA